jgi:hypothetical protein
MKAHAALMCTDNGDPIFCWQDMFCKSMALGRLGQHDRLDAEELTQEVHGQASLLPARSPHRHQDRLGAVPYLWCY